MVDVMLWREGDKRGAGLPPRRNVERVDCRAGLRQPFRLRETEATATARHDNDLLVDVELRERVRRVADQGRNVDLLVRRVLGQVSSARFGGRRTYHRSRATEAFTKSLGGRLEQGLCNHGLLCNERGASEEAALHNNVDIESGRFRYPKRSVTGKRAGWIPEAVDDRILEEIRASFLFEILSR